MRVPQAEMSRPRTHQGHRVRSQLETQGFHVHFGTIVPRRYQEGCDYPQGPAGSAASLLNLSNGSLLSTIQRSWYSVRMSTLMIPNPVSLPRTYYQSLLSSQQDTTGSDQLRIENDEEKLKTRKIWIYPTPEEREKLRKWMGIVRWMYNKVLEMVQDDRITDISIIREYYLNNKSLPEEFLWVKEAPKEVRSYTI